VTETPELYCLAAYESHFTNKYHRIKNIRTFATEVNTVTVVDFLPGSGLDFAIDSEADSLCCDCSVPTSVGNCFK